MSALAARHRVPAACGARLATLALAAAAATAPLARTQASGGPLQAQAEAILGGASGWGVMAWSLDRDEPLFAVNADQAMIIASNNKVFTSVFALDALGADYRFPTDVLVAGELEGGVLRGDVVIRGSGDPAFAYAQYDEDVMQTPRRMAEALARIGVRTVEGGIIADPYVFDRENFGPEWPDDTGMGAARYAPTVTGLPFNRNMLWIRLTPGEGEGFMREPDAPEIPVVVPAGASRGYAVRMPLQDTVRVRTGGPSGERFGIGAYEPAYLAGAALRQALREAGITVRGALRIDHTPEGADLVHRHLSLRLAEMVPQLNEKSDNFFAEHLYKAAVAKATGQGTYTGGPQASAVFFHQRAEVPWGELWQADGSGLSRQNRASPRALIRALAYAHAQPWSEEFHASMAVAGDRQGTMNRMFTTGPAAGNLHAKTGYIRGVRTLSGYVRTAGGENVVFSFLYNGGGTSGARGVQIQLGELLAGWSR
jgi:D-alanyl-D-alanine carboxypeptidase/D-alanyl-D-alanine-endopeptidase (penicillin-binding protein 4)